MISLIVHGGAWDIPDADVEAHRKGCMRALKTGWSVLQKGGTAIDAVEKAIRCMEDDPIFDAGYGSHLNLVGRVEMDASIMSGKALRCGAVAAVQRIKNPISLARIILAESEHILFVGDGAERFAKEHGCELCKPEELITKRELDRWKSLKLRKNFKTHDSFSKTKRPSDTVGAVALDKEGNVCAGTSTGGTMNKYPGRIGDSPLIGCGTYADNDIGGVSTTGWGEAMIRVVMAKTVVDLMEINNGNPQEAAKKGIELLHRKVDGFGGVIVMNNKGKCGVSYNTPRMARAYINSKMKEPFVSV